MVGNCIFSAWAQAILDGDWRPGSDDFREDSDMTTADIATVECDVPEKEEIEDIVIQMQKGDHKLPYNDNFSDARSMLQIKVDGVPLTDMALITVQVDLPHFYYGIFDDPWGCNHDDSELKAIINVSSRFPNHSKEKRSYVLFVLLWLSILCPSLAAAGSTVHRKARGRRRMTFGVV